MIKHGYLILLIKAIRQSCILACVPLFFCFLPDNLQLSCFGCCFLSTLLSVLSQPQVASGWLAESSLIRTVLPLLHEALCLAGVSCRTIKASVPSPGVLPHQETRTRQELWAVWLCLTLRRETPPTSNIFSRLIPIPPSPTLSLTYILLSRLNTNPCQLICWCDSVTKRRRKSTANANKMWRQSTLCGRVQASWSTNLGKWKLHWTEFIKNIAILACHFLHSHFFAFTFWQAFYSIFCFYFFLHGHLCDLYGYLCARVQAGVEVGK